ncbi:MAG: hypothetical protein IJH61_08885 [Eubacteriaceae bacterium]|nr:hypothetical protein [Eubacteriaceae bacterium]
MGKENMRNQINEMSHAFYSILGCLKDNMPDEAEYSQECSEIYESALEEFKNAEENARLMLNENNSKTIAALEEAINFLHVNEQYGDDWSDVIIELNYLVNNLKEGE